MQRRGNEKRNKAEATGLGLNALTSTASAFVEQTSSTTPLARPLPEGEAWLGLDVNVTSFYFVFTSVCLQPSSSYFM